MAAALMLSSLVVSRLVWNAGVRTDSSWWSVALPSMARDHTVSSQTASGWPCSLLRLWLMCWNIYLVRHWTVIHGYLKQCVVVHWVVVQGGTGHDEGGHVLGGHGDVLF